MNSRYYYGFEFEKSIYLLAVDDEENRFINYTTAKKSDLSKFVLLDDSDIEGLEWKLWFDLESFPITFRRFSVTEIEGE